LCKASWQAANYLQALISPRWKAVAFAQDARGDADSVGGIYYLDDQGRVIRCLVEKAEFGSVARVDAVVMMAQGLIEGRLPDTPGRHFFTIEGRQSVSLEPRAGRFSAFWLQDSSEQFADLRLEVREDGAWRPVQPEPTVAPAVNTPREKTYRLGSLPAGRHGSAVVGRGDAGDPRLARSGAHYRRRGISPCGGQGARAVRFVPLGAA
jgi:hypothetical protein